VELRLEQFQAGASGLHGVEYFCVIMYDLRQDDCHQVVITRQRELYKDEDWYLGLNYIDDYLFECCIKDLNAQLLSKLDMTNSRVRHRLRGQCKEARRNLFEGRDHAIELMNLCLGQDYRCSFRLASCSELRSGWSPRMTSLKRVVERELATEIKPKVEMIILMGSWNCTKHDQDFVGRCILCHHGVCKTCVKTGGKLFCQAFYICEACGPISWHKEPKRRECDRCGLLFEFDGFVGFSYIQKICDRCEWRKRNRGTTDDNDVRDVYVMDPCECTVDRGHGFYEALKERGVLEIDQCQTAFVVECVLKCFLYLVS
jgi:hypothetical protein